MEGQIVTDCFDAAYQAVKTHKDEIAKLDQVIGDGDHVFNLLRGMEALNTIRADMMASNASDALGRAAAKFLTTIGGSSGVLLSTLLAGMAKSLSTVDSTASLTDWAKAFADGVVDTQKRGKIGVGGKTMMDVLIPVSTRFSEMAVEGLNLSVILAELPEVAEQGMLSTRNMVAIKGRASFLGERSVGHIDPGARSCQLIIEAACLQLTKSTKGARCDEEVSQ